MRTALFLRKFQARDERGSSNFKITSTKLLCFEKISARNYRGSSNFQNT